jgi:regulator of sigma E protease
MPVHSITEFFQSAGNIVMVVIGFGMIIFVHELGHFLLAKRIGAKVEIFSLGFGPKLFGFTWGGTEYRLSLVPLGGYVKIKGQGVSSDKSESPDDFERKPVGKRMQVLVAGVAMNFLFAFPLCVAELLIGRQVPNNVVTEVAIGTPAFEAGVKAGDRIVSVVQSHKSSAEEISESEWSRGAVQNWDRLRRVMIFGDESKPIFLEVQRDSQPKPLKLRIPVLKKMDLIERDNYIGMQAGMVKVNVNSIPADSAQSDPLIKGDKLEKGDVIKTAMGVPIDDPELLMEIVMGSYERASAEAGALWPADPSAKPQGASVPMTIQRGGETLQKSIVTRIKGYYDIGLELYRKPVVGKVRAFSVADRNGIKPGDIITGIGFDMGLAGPWPAPKKKVEVQKWHDIEAPLAEYLAMRRANPDSPSLKTMLISIERPAGDKAEKLEVEIEPEQGRAALGALAAAGITTADSFAAEMLGIAPKAELYVWHISPRSPLAAEASSAGVPGTRIAEGDRVLAIGTIDLSRTDMIITPKQLQLLMSSLFPVTPENTASKNVMVVSYRKPGEEKEGKFHQVGVWNPPVTYRAWLEMEPGMAMDRNSLALDQEDLGGALARGAVMPFDIVVLTYQSVAAMMKGTVGTDQLSGPVGIFQMSYKTVEMGISSFLWFLAFISVSLAVLNILPVPVLDGGHVAFLVVEKVRGKPVSERIRGRLEMVGLVLLLALVVFATWNDIYTRVLGH